MSSTCKLLFSADVPQHTVSRYLYSQFAEHLGRCIYEGIWVGNHPKIPNDNGIRLDTIAALKQLALPCLRWPGGCFADNYHWTDGVGPQAQRPRRHNMWWNQPETNQFGTDEFLRFCGLIGTEPYLCTNVGSGTVEEARSWAEYCNSTQDTTLTAMRKANGHPEPYGVKWWGVGNENWGCGGTMTPRHYAEHYRQFVTYLRGTAGPEAKMIACGAHENRPEWDEQFLDAMKGALHQIDFLAMHTYSWGGGSDLDFSVDEYRKILASINLLDRELKRAVALTRAYSYYGHPIRVALDEWGTWYSVATVQTGLYQQNTLRDALFAAAAFHCFHRHEGLFMTNMAQTINVLQSLLLTRGEQLVCTPTYHVFDMFQPHREGRLLPCNSDLPVLDLVDSQQITAISSSATLAADGKSVFVSLVNLDLDNDYTVNMQISGQDQWKLVSGQVLTAPDIHDHNTFETPEQIVPAALDVQMIDLKQLSVPAHTLITLSFELA